MSAKSLLAFIGGCAVGATAAILLAPKSGADTREFVIAYLKSKGFTKEKIDEIWDKIKDNIFAWSSMSDIEIAVKDAIKESED